MQNQGWHSLTPLIFTQPWDLERLSKAALLEGFWGGLAVASKGLKSLRSAKRSPGASAAVQKQPNAVPEGVCSWERTLSLVTPC